MNFVRKCERLANVNIQLATMRRTGNTCIVWTAFEQHNSHLEKVVNSELRSKPNFALGPVLNYPRGGRDNEFKVVLMCVKGLLVGPVVAQRRAGVFSEELLDVVQRRLVYFF